MGLLLKQQGQFADSLKSLKRAHELGHRSASAQIVGQTEQFVLLDAKLPEFPGRIQRDQWVTQARALHESKYGQGVPDLRARG